MKMENLWFPDTLQASSSVTPVLYLARKIYTSITANESIFAEVSVCGLAEGKKGVG